MTNKLKKEIEEQRKFWEKIAKENKWHTTPFYIQVWVTDGKVTDSVSFKGIEKDIIIKQSTIK